MSYEQDIITNKPVIYKSSNYTITNADKNSVIAFNTFSGALTATLPTGLASGETITIKISEGNNDLTILPTGTDTINNDVSLLLENTEGGKTSVVLVYDGAGKWLAVSDYVGPVKNAFARLAVVSSTLQQLRTLDLSLNVLTNNTAGQASYIMSMGDSLYTIDPFTKVVRRHDLNGVLLNTSQTFTNAQYGITYLGNTVYASVWFATAGVSALSANNLAYQGTASVFSTNVSSDGQYLYSINQVGGSISKINPSTMVSVATLTLVGVGVGVYKPAFDNDFIYVGSGGPSGNGIVWKISKATFSVVSSINLGVSADPRFIAIIGNTLYTTGNSSNTIFKIDTATMTLISSVATGTAPQNITTDGTYLYYCTVNGITKIDQSLATLATNAMTGAIGLTVY